MARKKRDEVLAGAFVVGAVSLFVLLFFLKGTLGELFRPTGEVQVIFDDIRGLKAGDPVFFLGSKVGQVKALEIERRSWGSELVDLFPKEKREAAKVRITLRLARRALALLRTDSPVEIDKNLTGNLSVLLREGSGLPLPSGGAVLRGSSGAELAGIAGSVKRILEKVDPAVADFAAFARRLTTSGSLEQAVEDLAQLARELREGMRPIQLNLEQALAQAKEILHENRGDIRAAAAHLAEGSAVVHRLLERIEPAAEDLRGALTQLERAGASVAVVLDDNRRGLAAIVDDARTAVSNAALITADVRRRPWRLLYRPSKDESDSLDLYDAAWAYNLGAAELERSLRELTSQIDREQGGPKSGELQTAYSRVQESLRRHQEVEKAFWTRLQGR